MTTTLPLSASRESDGARVSVSLDGIWDFRLEGRGGWRKARVPAPWQAEFEDLRDATGVGVYRRTLELPEGREDRELALRFGAVGYYAEVSLNGEPIGAHEGGYLPFEVVLPPRLLRAANEIELRATLPSADEALYPDFPFQEIPHGKQSWYGMLGGPWQSVTLESRDPRHVRELALFPDPSTGRVRVAARLAAPAGRLVVTLAGPDGRVVAEAEAPAGGTEVEMALSVPEVALWSPETPLLYEARVALEAEGRVTDRRAKTFGFRSFEAREGRFYLNGVPFYMRGALDQDYYPDAIATPPSLEFLEEQIVKAKALGLNLLRCHIKVPDPRYYEAADRLGMLIWTEIPNVETFTEASARRLRETMEGVLVRDGHHPCIVAWTLINEDWGMRLREAPEQRAWLAEAYDWLKAADPARLVVDNSPCAPNFHVKTDVNDFHYYRTIPERREEWDLLTAEFAADADWAWSPFGDAQKTGAEPRVVSEFGAWGLPDPKLLRAPGGADPWWFQAGTLWGEGTATPGGIEARFRALALDTVFGGFDAFIEAAQWHQFANLKYQIETLRAAESIAGYVITEFTDLHWEANGLLDIARNPRVFHDRFAEVNAEIVIIPGVDRWAWRSGETLTLAPRISAGGASVPEGARLVWRLDDGPAGEATVAAIAPLAVASLEPLAVALPEVALPRMATLRLALKAPGGAELATSRVEIALHPRREGPPRAVRVASDDRAIEARLDALGHVVVAQAEAEVFLTRHLDAPRVEALRLGQHVLLLAEGETGRERVRQDPPPREPPQITAYDAMPGIPSQPYFVFPGFGVKERNRTIWRGDWIGNFSWLRRTGPLAALPGGPMLDLTFDRVVPHSVLTGFRPWEYEGRIHAGVVVGWVHKPAAFLLDKRFGAGRLTATTFRLTEDPPGFDPTATTLFDAFLALAAPRAAAP